MYNKLFTKILDSSIWLEAMPTRLVWLTMIAAMDEDGFVACASPANLAHRAIVPLEDTERALETLEGPDKNSSDSDREGRRIERVPGGWIVLNAKKYQQIVTRSIARERTNERVRKHRERKAKASKCNADVTACNASVTPSDTYSDTDNTLSSPPAPDFDEFWNRYDKKVDRKQTYTYWTKMPTKDRLAALEGVAAYIAAHPEQKYRVDPIRYLKREKWQDELPAAPTKCPYPDGSDQAREWYILNDLVIQ